MRTLVCELHKLRCSYDTGLGKEQFSFVPSYKGLEKHHHIVHHEANILAKECSGHSVSCSKQLIEDKIVLVENGSEQVFIYLDKILEEKNILRYGYNAKW